MEAIFVCVFVPVTAGNWGIAAPWYVQGKRRSLVPLIGGPAGAAACLTLPFPTLAQWWWVPFIADAGKGDLVIVFATRSGYSSSKG